MSIFKQTPTQKLKGEISRLRKQLFEVCVNPDSDESKSIIVHHKMLKAYSKNKTSFSEYLKKIDFGTPSINTAFTHYENKLDK